MDTPPSPYLLELAGSNQTTSPPISFCSLDLSEKVMYINLRENVPQLNLNLEPQPLILCNY